jgi:hypothetical protein
MTEDKQDKLRQAGWKVGDADSFLNQQMTEVTLCEKPDRNGMRQCVTIEESALREAGYVKATEFAEKVRELIHDLAEPTGLSDDDIRILDGLDKIEEEL